MWCGPCTKRSSSTRVVAERVLRLAARGGELVGELGLLRDQAHALAAAAGDRLHEQREADLLRLARRGSVSSWFVAVVAGNHRHAGLLHDRLGAILEAHLLDRLGRGADEDEPGLLDRAREVLVLGEEAVARMDRLGAAGLRDLDDPLASQVGVRGARAADAVRLVGHLHVQRVRVDRPSAPPPCARRGVRQVRMTRQAISPRLAMRIFENTEPGL